MDLRDALQHTLDGVGTVIELLEQLTRLTSNAADDVAVEVVRITHDALEAALHTMQGHASPETVRSWVDKLRSDIATNDQVADQALADKFPTGDDD